MLDRKPHLTYGQKDSRQLHTILLTAQFSQLWFTCTNSDDLGRSPNRPYSKDQESIGKKDQRGTKNIAIFNGETYITYKALKFAQKNRVNFWIKRPQLTLIINLEEIC